MLRTMDDRGKRNCSAQSNHEGSVVNIGKNDKNVKKLNKLKEPT